MAAEAQPAGVRLQSPDQHLYQGRFAGTVRADDAEAVAAPDARREVFEEGEVAEALRQVLGLDDGVAAAPAAGSLQLGGADLSQPLCALAAQPLQAGEAADVALAPGSPAAGQPAPPASSGERRRGKGGARQARYR